MNNIKTLIGLEFKLNRKPGSKKKNIILNILFGILSFLAIALVSYIAVYALILMGIGGDIIGVCSFLVLVIMIILFVYSITNQLKTLFLYKHKTILAYIPVSKWQIYLSKLISCLINIYVLNFFLYVPIMISFGIILSLPLNFYLLALALGIVLPMFPFGLACLFVIPLMFVYNWLQNKNVLKLLISVTLTVVGFYFYMKIIFNIATLTLLKDVPTDNIVSVIISFCTTKYLPSTWFASVVLNRNVWSNVLISVLSTLCLIVVGVAIGILSYRLIFNKSLTKKNYSKHIKSSSKVKNAFMSYFVLELKDIFRNSNYAYTYFGMAIAMPVMVWYCNKFILEFAVEKIGSNIIFGTTLLVVFVFVSIICSPTSAFISKEGDNFWILKTNPKGISIPLFAKSLISIISSTLAVAISIVAICLGKFVSWQEGLLILALSIVYIIGLVSMGLLLNLQRPNIFYSNKENNSNMIIHMLISFFVSVLIGIFAIFFSFKIEIIYIALLCLVAVFVFSVINVILLLTQHKRLYVQMER